MKKDWKRRWLTPFVVFLMVWGGVFIACSHDSNSGGVNWNEKDDPEVPSIDDTQLSTHLVDLTATGVKWDATTNSVTNTSAGEAWLVYNRKVNIAQDNIILQAKVKHSSGKYEHNGLAFISVDGTRRRGYQVLSVANIKNAGCTGGGSGQGFDNKKDGYSDTFVANKEFILKLELSSGKLNYYVIDASDGESVLASKLNASVYHTDGDIVYPAFGGATSNLITFSDIKITVNGNPYTIDGIDPQNQLPTLSLDSNVLRIKSSETGTIKATATYNGETAKVTATASESGIVNLAVADDGTITVTPLKTTPGVTVTVTNVSAPYIKASFTTVVADYPTENPDLSDKVYPAVGAESAYTDGALRITFDSEPTLNKSSFVAIFGDDGEIVDTITMSDEKQTTNANTVKVSHQLVRVSGNDVYITPHFGKLENGKTYYVAIPEGAITGKIGEADFKGLSNEKDAADAWKFTTRAARSASDTMSVSTAEVESTASGAPDFRTIYGALAAIGTSNSGSYTINVAAGEYYELVNAKLAATVTIVGPDTAECGTGTDPTKNAVITYINHNDWNGGTDTRPSFYVTGGGNLVLKNLTIWNKTKRGVDTDNSEAQAEALYFKSAGTLAAYNCTFKSYQDTIQVGNQGGKAWFYKCYVEGDVDFLWGTADVALFEECTLKALNDSARSTKSEDLLVARTYLKDNTIGKGFVVFNSEIEVEDKITLSFGRNAGKGADYYDQCAVVDTKVTGSGKLSDAWWSEKEGYTPLENHEKHVGWKDYNITSAAGTALSPRDKRLAKTSAIAADVYSAEYNGRRAILNRVYSVSAKKYADGDKWDETKLSALESEFGPATTDASKNNVYEEVWLAKTWDFATTNTPERTSNGTTWIKTDGTKSATAPSASDAAIYIYGDATKETGNSYIDPKGTLYGSAVLYVPVASGSGYKVTVTYNVNTNCYLTIGGVKYESTTSTSVVIDCSSATLKTSTDISALVSDISYLPIELGSETLSGTNMKGYVSKIVVDKN